MEIHITCGNNLPNTDKILLIEVVASGNTVFKTIEVNTLNGDELLVFNSFETFVNNQNLCVINNSPFIMGVSIITPNEINNNVSFIEFNDLLDVDKEKLLALYTLISSKLD